ncbi:tetratricopeptide repeat protein [Aporhodopirellula aestuarii]|uniref:Tetratricopeptide repeat protein n=1 Tax=Aporhodopirellula aestuarii TaxID=2950107 RepID=A0ABT0U6V1_9BACT|nr:tetratricopeptide repeat protein [Aporhodopirellula aestuarii]MCM2372516.1 tetratricopeptide repeat protein [Aporhodopirellula aestuarii]
MSQSNPFTDPNYLQSTTPPPPSTKRVLTILGIVVALIVLSCAGISAVAVVALKRIAEPDLEVALAPRENAFDFDAEDFNHSLEMLFEDRSERDVTPMDPTLQQFLDSSIATLELGNEVPFSLPMFVEAVAMSEHSGGSLNILERTALLTWLKQYEPSPDILAGESRVLDVRMDSTGKLAEVDLISYSDDAQAQSNQWFLVRESNQWKFYDWQRLEFGRRMSDEYASYLQGDPPLDEGYDNAQVQLNDAELAWWDDDRERAKRLIRGAENLPMLKEDRPSLKLQAAYTWMRLEQYDEAVRVLKSIKEPDALWGVWPSLAVSYCNLEEYEQTLDASQKALQQSPNHPNAHWIASIAYGELGRKDEASEAAIRAVRVCPTDSVMFYNAISRMRPQHVSQLVDVVIENDEEDQWLQLLSQTYRRSSEISETIVDDLKKREQLPSGVLSIAIGNQAWGNDQFDEAARRFLDSRRSADRDYIRELASQNHLDVRLDQDDFEKLFAESSGDDSLLRDLALRAYDESLYCDPDKLLTALHTHASDNTNGWGDALKGWADYSNGDYEDAIKSLDDFANWRRSHGSSSDEPQARTDETDDDSWVDHTIAEYLVYSLLELDRPLEIIERWPNDAGKHSEIGSHLLSYATESEIDQFLESTSTTGSDSIKVQRLRLQAGQAMSQDLVEEAVSRHREAIALASTVYDEEENYYVAELVRQLGRDLVVGKYLSASDDLSKLELDETIDLATLAYSAIRESIRICDDTQLDAWLNHASQVLEDADDSSGLQSDIGDYYVSRDQLPKAIEAYKRCVEASDEESWGLTQRYEAVVRTMVHAGRIDEAKEWLATNPIPDALVAGEAVIDLARSDFESLQKHLAIVDKATASDWLEDQPLLSIKNRQSTRPGLIKLISEYPIRIPYASMESSGTLLRSGVGSVDLQQIGKAFEVALGEKFSSEEIVQGIDHRRRFADDAWVFESVSGQRIVVSVGERRYETEQLSGWLGERLNAAVTRIHFGFMDDRPDPARRLFEAALALADDDAIAFSWSGGREVWSGPRLNEDLTWKGRVPIHSANTIASLIEVLPEDGGDDLDYDDGYLDLEEWDQLKKDAGGEMRAILSIYANGVEEEIPCTVTKVDVDEYEMTISPTRSSVLLPIVQAGVAYTTGPSYLTLPKSATNDDNSEIPE